jgi:hypothetical protein
MLAKRDPITGAMANVTLADDSDEEDKKPQETPEEIRARHQREREEKQRRYDEVRAKIFGDGGSGGSSNSKGGSGRSSGATTPGTTTPPRPGGERRGRGRGRAGFRGGDRNSRHDRAESGDCQRIKEGTQSGSLHLREDGRERELYDPNVSPRLASTIEKRKTTSTSGRSTPRSDEQAIRAPRGPDGTGRGGFGFARRGTKED